MNGKRKTSEKKPKQKPGPKPDVLNIKADDWKQAVGQATKAKRPKDGWPEPEGDPDKAKDPPQDNES